jgi:predicted transcriptional regulator
MLQAELATRALSLCNEAVLSVSQLAGKMGGNHAKMIDLIRELQTRGLLLRTTERRGKGRPLCLLHTTPLGEQFMEQYNRLLNLRLLSNDNDIKKALHQADLARRLVEQQISPYARFQEVNELARNIASTAQTSRGS